MVRSQLAVILGVFLCVSVALPAGLYPVRIAENHRHLVDRNGKPYLIQGDAPWSLIVGLTTEEAAQYLDVRKRQGFNSIIVNLIEHKFRGPVNRYGDGPFTTPADFSTPNEKYFEHADQIIRMAGDRGMQVFLAPIYLGYIGTDEGWIEEALANGPEKCRGWGRYVGKRYRDFDNLVWLIGGDRNPEKAHEDINAIVAGIKEFDDRHVFTAHCHPENSAVDQYGKDGWLELNATYTYNIVHRMLLADYNRKPVLPFFLEESTYEGEHNASAVQVRRQAYWAVLCGATGQFMGNRPMWLFDPGWQEALNSTGAQDMARWGDLFGSRPWYELVPDEKHEVVVDGLGEFRGLDYLAAARSNDGSLVMAYMPTARTITVDMSKMAGPAKASWFNPRMANWVEAGRYPSTGKKPFTPPGDGDWVLLLEQGK